jgi:hypothetical protein
MTMGPALGPLGFGEILDAGFRLWRNHFRTFIIVAAALNLPLLLINAYVTWDQVLAVVDGVPYVWDVDAFNRTQLILSLAGMVATLITVGAVVLVAVRGYLGRPTRPVEAFHMVMRRFFPLLGLLILMGLGLVAGFMAFIIPGIFLSVAWQLALPAFWEENLSPLDCLGRSYRLVKGRWWTLFGIVIVLWVILMAFSFIGMTLFLGSLLGDSVMLYVIVNALTTAISSIVLVPMAPAIITVFYFDSRVRREGFDVEIEARRLDQGDLGPA